MHNSIAALPAGSVVESILIVISSIQRCLLKLKMVANLKAGSIDGYCARRTVGNIIFAQQLRGTWLYAFTDFRNLEWSSW
jgi:hypothetical protein